MMSGDDSETAGRIDEVYGYSRALSFVRGRRYLFMYSMYEAAYG